MLIKELKPNANRRMEIGPDEYDVIVKCDRCGKVKPSDANITASFWYCSDNSVFSQYLPRPDPRVDYCMDCIKTDEERSISAKSAGKHVLSQLIPAGWKIGRNLRGWINLHKQFQADCQAVLEFIQNSNHINKDFVLKKLKKAFEYSMVTYPENRRVEEWTR